MDGVQKRQKGKSDGITCMTRGWYPKVMVEHTSDVGCDRKPSSTCSSVFRETMGEDGVLSEPDATMASLWMLKIRASHHDNSTHNITKGVISMPVSAPSQKHLTSFRESLIHMISFSLMLSERDCSMVSTLDTIRLDDLHKWASRETIKTALRHAECRVVDFGVNPSIIIGKHRFMFDSVSSLTTT